MNTAGHEVHENEQSVKQEAVYPKTNTLSPSQLQRLLQTKPHVPSSPLLTSANGTALGAQEANSPEVSVLPKHLCLGGAKWLALLSLSLLESLNSVQ